MPAKRVHFASKDTILSPHIHSYYASPSSARDDVVIPPLPQSGSADIKHYHSSRRSHSYDSHGHRRASSSHTDHPVASRHRASSSVGSPGASSHCTVHPIIASSSRPSLKYDLALYPSASTITTNIPTVPPHVLSEAATYPPLSSITLVSPRLAWRFTIHASSSHHHGSAYVTIFDLLRGLHEGLRRNATSDEYYALPEKERSRVRSAYEHRYRRLRDDQAYAEEKRAGLKRIDFLMDHTTFMGLSPTRIARDVWSVNVL